jgi:hypothetical protein
LFIAGTVAEMAPKPRLAEGEENPFLPPPVDLDKIPLVDKDRLIVDTICDFDFSDLQSWLREVFLDQSDEIGLWESNLPLYLFPQIHHFLKFTLKCQAHYIPDQRAIVSSSGAVSKDDLSTESSNFRVVPSHLRSIHFHQSTLPIIHVLHQGKPDHFLPLRSVRILFRPVGR